MYSFKILKETNANYHASPAIILLDITMLINIFSSPAHCAAAKGAIDNLQLIIEHKGDIWLQNSRGEYPIHEASLARQNGNTNLLILINNYRGNF